MIFSIEYITEMYMNAYFIYNFDLQNPDLKYWNKYVKNTS